MTSLSTTHHSRHCRHRRHCCHHRHHRHCCHRHCCHYHYHCQDPTLTIQKTLHRTTQEVQYPTQDTDYPEDSVPEAMNQKAIELIDWGLLHREMVDQNALHREADREADRKAETVDCEAEAVDR